MAREGAEREPLIEIRPAPARRAAAVGMSAVLGLLLLWVAAAAPPRDLGWLAFLLGAGAASLWLAWWQWRATAQGLVLSRAGLAETGGRLLAALDEIEAVERGVLAFKPSGGFLVRLRRPAARHWAPGLWWRMGRRLGVGGVTGRAETRAMAELLAVMLAERARG